MTRKIINRRLRKTFAVAMSAMLVMSSSSFHVLADTVTATDSNATVSTTSGDGTLENPQVTQTTTTIEDPTTGNITVIIDIEQTGTGTNENGAVVDYEHAEETLTVKNSDGTIIAQTGAEAGSETTTITSSSSTTEELDITPNDNKSTVTGATQTTTETGTFETTTSYESDTTYENIDLEYVGDISVTLQPGETKTETITTSETKLADENLEIPESSITTEIDEVTGTTTTTNTEVTPVLDANGNTIGYTTKTVVTTVAPTTNTTTEQIGETDTTSETGETTTDTAISTTISLPEKPQASETPDSETGNKTTTTVEELYDESGNVVGYQSTITVTDASGNTISSGVESVWGTKTTTVTTETTPTTTTTSVNNLITSTTTTVITEATTRAGEKVVATDRQVTASMSQITSSKTHGHVDTTSIVPDTSIQPSVDGAADWEMNGTDLRNPIENVSSGGFNGYDFQYQGNYGLESAIGVDLDPNDGAGTCTTVHQFVLKGKDGSVHYVLCADYGTNAQKTYNYSMENVEDADYYSDDDAKIISSIALTGYWGTESGVGSLDALKSTLTTALQEAEANNSSFFLTQYQIDNLTEGEALTATQAAIWYYANCSDEDRLDANDITEIAYIGNNTHQLLTELDTAKGLVSGTTENTVNGLYQYLINLSPTENDRTTSFITEENFAKETTILVGDLAADENGNLLAVNTDDNDDNDVYNTEITFSLSIIPSEINDDLIVTVYDSNNNPIAKKRLAGDDNTTNYGRIYQNTDENGNGIGTYTISDLKIAEGLSITLNLSGTQHLDTGVYLYSSEMRGTTTSQTFIGIAQGERDVNLNVSLAFTVDEPTAQVESTSSGSTKTKTDTTTETRTDVVSESKVKATVVVTTEETEKTERKWENGWGYEATPENEDPTVPSTPDNPKKDDDNDKPDKPSTPTTTTTTEEPTTPNQPTAVEAAEYNSDIPTAVLGASDDFRAVAPATGDASTLWILLTAISGALLSAFNLSEKKRRKSVQK